MSATFFTSNQKLICTQNTRIFPKVGLQNMLTFTSHPSYHWIRNTCMGQAKKKLLDRQIIWKPQKIEKTIAIQCLNSVRIYVPVTNVFHPFFPITSNAKVFAYISTVWVLLGDFNLKANKMNFKKETRYSDEIKSAKIAHLRRFFTLLLAHISITESWNTVEENNQFRKEQKIHTKMWLLRTMKTVFSAWIKPFDIHACK